MQQIGMYPEDREENPGKETPGTEHGQPVLEPKNREPKNRERSNRESWNRAGRATGPEGVRTVVVASADAGLRSRLRAMLEGLRWEVREAHGGAELFSQIEAYAAGTAVLDSWLPDLDAEECARELAVLYPGLDILAIDGTGFGAGSAKGAYRNELLHVLSRVQQAEPETAFGSLTGVAAGSPFVSRSGGGPRAVSPVPSSAPGGIEAHEARGKDESRAERRARERRAAAPLSGAPELPELLGSDPQMLEVGRRIRLVAPRSTSVLVQGPTGTGKELVAHALHRLSPRAARPFVALNCAAIPEALLEAELFGHTRGAFTGAVHRRTGRLEAAHGGTLFLDEIGELPLALQAKLLRFVERGELQRVGENETVRVDVRIVAATHRRLARMAAEGSFRADLYYRLSVFLIQTPALAGRTGDIALLAERILDRLAGGEPPKILTPQAFEALAGYSWPGNVRELEHTLERAWILSEESPSIDLEDIDFGEIAEP